MKYRPEIDGLRAVAVVPVLFFHAGFPGFAGGYLGVDVFFVISGYLITSIVATQVREDRFSVALFYERRARRLMPALFTVLAATTLAAMCVSFPAELRRFGVGLAAIALYASNVLFWRQSGYFEPAAEENPLLHTWSLAVEEQFYVVFPLFLLFAWRWLRSRQIVAVSAVFVASLALAEWASHTHPDANFFLTPFRAWELMAGALLALSPEVLTWFNDRPRFALAASWTGLAAVLVPMAAFDATTPTPGLLTLWAVGGTVLLIACSTPARGAGRFLTLRPMVHIGLISYSLYLWHQPLLALAKQYMAGDLSLPAAGLALGLSFVLAYLSWRFVETPFRKNSRYSRKLVFTATGLGSATLIAAGVVLYLGEGLPGRFAPEVQQILAAHDDRNPRRAECLAGPGGRIGDGPKCFIGAEGLEPSVVLWGDSHADALTHPLSEHLASVGRNGVALTYTGCPPVPGLHRLDKPPSHRCNDHNARALQQALADSIDTVILMSRWTVAANSPRFHGEGCIESGRPFSFGREDQRGAAPQELREEVANALAETTSMLLDAGKRVILIESVPEQGCDVPNRLARQWSRGDSLRGSGQPRHLFDSRQRPVAEIFALIPPHPRLCRIAPADIFCDDRTCHMWRGGTVLYFDDDHLTLSAAEDLVDQLPLEPVAGPPR